jgi:hypothetical protein
MSRLDFLRPYQCDVNVGHYNQQADKSHRRDFLAVIGNQKQVKQMPTYRRVRQPSLTSVSYGWQAACPPKLYAKEDGPFRPHRGVNREKALQE